MILRRFMQHTKEQNWFAVGLDVIVVIVGIFLGMQVTEWNEARQQLESDKVFMDQLASDLRVIRRSLVKAKEAHDWHKRNGMTALAVLAGEPVTDQNRETVESGILFVHQLPFPRTRLGNFGMLLDKQEPVPASSGSLRKELIEFLDEMSFRLQIYDHIKMAVDSSLTVLTTRVAAGVTGETGISQILDIDSLRKDEEFIASLQNIVYRHEEASRQIDIMIEHIDQFLEKLQ